ncbi:MAG: hypothetical protein AB7J35_02425 [Dehalococcoidia bacterium]
MSVVIKEKTAYLSNEDSPDIRNPIHSTEVAMQFGFAGALVGGVTVYGWAAETVIETLGEEWLDSGWVEMNFKRPVYPAEQLKIKIGEDDGGGLGRTMTVEGNDGSIRIDGRVGLGTAPWFSELATPYSLSPSVPVTPHSQPLTLKTAPVGQSLIPVAMEMDVDSVREYASGKQRSTDPRFIGDKPRLHPAMIAGFETMMIYGQFEFSPGIHVFSRVQHLQRADAAPGYVAVGKFIEAFERKGRHHGIVDGSLVRNGSEFARSRQGLIFSIEK